MIGLVVYGNVTRSPVTTAVEVSSISIATLLSENNGLNTPLSLSIPAQYSREVTFATLVDWNESTKNPDLNLLILPSPKICLSDASFSRSDNTV